jgi:tetratricopeptide (TPR) repeat protein
MYRDIIERHPDNLIYIGHVAELMNYIYRYEDGARLQDYLLTKQRPDSNPVDLAKRLNGRGISLKNIGDLEGAMAAYKEAEVIARNLGDQRLLATILGNEGNVLRRQGNLTQARAVLNEAVVIARRLKSVEVSGPCLNALGLLYFENDENEEALRIFIELEVVGRASGEPLMLAAALGNKGTLMERLWEGTPEELLAIRSEEVEIYRDLGAWPKLLEALKQKQKIIHRQIRRLSRRPVVELDEEDKQQLLTCYLEEKSICSEFDDAEGELLAQSRRAVVLAALGRPDAIELIEGALSRALSENMLDAVEQVRADKALVSEISGKLRRG